MNHHRHTSILQSSGGQFCLDSISRIESSFLSEELVRRDSEAMAHTGASTLLDLRWVWRRIWLSGRSEGGYDHEDDQSWSVWTIHDYSKDDSPPLIMVIKLAESHQLEYRGFGLNWRPTIVGWSGGLRPLDERTCRWWSLQEDQMIQLWWSINGITTLWGLFEVFDDEADLRSIIVLELLTVADIRPELQIEVQRSRAFAEQCYWRRSLNDGWLSQWAPISTLWWHLKMLD